MKKSILALSLLSTSSLIATNLDIYGVAHASVDSIDNGTFNTIKVSSNSSRLGVKGSTDIGSGLTILGQFETGVDLTGTGSDDGNGGDVTNNAALFTSARDSFVGVKGDFGMVLAGNLPIVNQWMYDYNLFADQVGDLGNLWGTSYIPDRANDTVAYFIPTDIDGLSGDIAYISDLSDTNDGNQTTAFLAKVNYVNSGFKVGVGYLALNKDNKTVAQKNPSELVITGSYTTDNFSIGGGYLKDLNYNFTDKDRTSYTAGVSYTINDTTLKTQWANIDNDAVNSNATMIAVGVDYALSNDAIVYIAYAGTSNDDLAAYKANNWGHGKSAYGTPEAGKDPSSVSLGLLYKFSGNIYNK